MTRVFRWNRCIIVLRLILLLATLCRQAYLPTAVQLEPPIQNNSDSTTENYTQDRGDIGIRGFWDKQFDCIVDIRKTYPESNSYRNSTVEKQEKEKKKKYLQPNDLQKNDVTHEWSTMAGTFKTTRLAEIKLKLPELSDSAEINVNCHVTKQKSNYDLILGREILRELGINLNFSNNTTNWNYTSIPMKPVHNSTRTHFTISDSKRVASETKRIKKF